MLITDGGEEIRQRKRRIDPVSSSRKEFRNSIEFSLPSYLKGNGRFFRLSNDSIKKSLSIGRKIIVISQPVVAIDSNLNESEYQ